MSKQELKQKGFTIIEVVLVLAVAALIFLMVFIALPALQKGQRDTQRKDDLSRISTQLQNYAGNNRGAIPGDDTKMNAFVRNYLGGNATGIAGSEYVDPLTGSGYVFTFASATATDKAPDTEGEITYYASAKCQDGGDGAVVSGTARQYALQIKLESQGSPYCLGS